MTVTEEMLSTYPKDLGGIDQKKLVDCIDACLACAQACTACADACLSCANECEQHTMHEHCTICAEACRRCEQACVALLESL